MLACFRALVRIPNGISGFPVVKLSDSYVETIENPKACTPKKEYDNLLNSLNRKRVD